MLSVHCFFCVFLLIFATCWGDPTGCPKSEDLQPCRCNLKYGTIYEVSCLGLQEVDEVTNVLQKQFSMNNTVHLKWANSNIGRLSGGVFQNSGLQINKLLLEDDDISTIDEDAFSGLEEQLEYLSLSNNHLTAVPAHQTSRLRHLQTLSLNENSIGEVNHDDFQNLTNLTTLALYSNKIDYIDSDILPKDLRYLVLGGNQFKYLGDSIRHLHKINMLNLRNNQLTSVTGDLPQSVTLHFLTLDNNRLTNIYGLCNGLPGLKTLLLYHNRIRSLRGVLRGCPRLKTLNMAYNRLTKIRGDEFKNNVNLTTLDLSHNKLDTLNSALINLSHLEELILSHNRLTNIGSHDLRGLTNLRSLNLSHNRIDSLHNVFKFPLPSLSILRISNNKISYIDDDLAELSLLCNVDLTNNDIFSLGPELLRDARCPTDRIHLQISGNPLLCNFQTTLSLRELRSRSVDIDAPPDCQYH